MTTRIASALALAAFTSACGASTSRSPSAPTALVARFDAGLTTQPSSAVGGAAGFEVSECCGAAAYLAYLAEREDDPEDSDPAARRPDRVFQGGLEAAAIMPWLDHRMRFHLQGGIAGTPPQTPRLGRRGFAGSLLLVWRLTEPTPPPANDPSPLFELAVGPSVWTLDSERTSAGPMEGTRSRVDLMLTARFGAAFGLDLQ